MVSWEYPPNTVGGIGRHVAELAPMLAGLKSDDGPISIDLLTPHYAGGQQVESITPFLTVYRVEMPSMDVRDLYNSVVANNSAFVDAAERLAEHHYYNLIHVHDWLTGSAGITLKQRWKTPLLATIHATERGRHQGHIASNTSYQIDQMEWRLCFETWRVIVCSQYMRHELHDYFGAPFDKLEVIVNGIRTAPDAGCIEHERESLHQHYAPSGEKLLLFVGRISHEKGLHVLIRAMPRILAHHPEVRLLVAGKNGNQMWPLAYELNVEQAVHFLGYVTDRRRDCLYQVVDAAVFPSLYEPFGIVALEAMALNCNVIASAVGGLGEVVKHGQNGLTVYANDPLSIGWAVNQLLADPQAAAARRVRAFNDVHSIYQWQAVAAQTAQLYAKVVEERQWTNW